MKTLEEELQFSVKNIHYLLDRFLWDTLYTGLLQKEEFTPSIQDTGGIYNLRAQKFRQNYDHNPLKFSYIWSRLLYHGSLDFSDL